MPLVIISVLSQGEIVKQVPQDHCDILFCLTKSINPQKVPMINQKADIFFSFFLLKLGDQTTAKILPVSV